MPLNYWQLLSLSAICNPSGEMKRYLPQGESKTLAYLECKVVNIKQ